MWKCLWSPQSPQHIWCSLGKGIPFLEYQAASHLRAFALVVPSERKAPSPHTTWLAPSSTNLSKNVTTWTLGLSQASAKVAPSYENGEVTSSVSPPCPPNLKWHSASLTPDSLSQHPGSPPPFCSIHHSVLSTRRQVL